MDPRIFIDFFRIFTFLTILGRGWGWGPQTFTRKIIMEHINTWPGLSQCKSWEGESGPALFPFSIIISTPMSDRPVSEWVMQPVIVKSVILVAFNFFQHGLKIMFSTFLLWSKPCSKLGGITSLKHAFSLFMYEITKFLANPKYTKGRYEVRQLSAERHGGALPPTLIGIFR